MSRIFLAILALFAGIAAQVSPAEARVRAGAEIGAVQVNRAVARVAAAVQIAARYRPLPKAFSAANPAPLRPAFAAIVMPTVWLGPDRALE